MDELILVTRTAGTLYKNGIRKDELVKSKYLFCNFALQEVGSFLPESLALPYLKNDSLRKITLLDFEAPKISCYKIEKN